MNILIKKNTAYASQLNERFRISSVIPHSPLVEKLATFSIYLDTKNFILNNGTKAPYIRSPTTDKSTLITSLLFPLNTLLMFWHSNSWTGHHTKINQINKSVEIYFECNLWLNSKKNM